MKEAQAIAFYRAVLKAAPSLTELKDSEAAFRLSDVFRAVFALAPTRDHIRVALAEHRGNRVKRSWDLKQRYLIAVLLDNPSLSDKSVRRFLKMNFNQRTRPGVITSCREEAERLRKVLDSASRKRFVLEVEQAMVKRSKEGNVLS